jgi:hypothetical protein
MPSGKSKSKPTNWGYFSESLIYFSEGEEAMKRYCNKLFQVSISTSKRKTTPGNFIIVWAGNLCIYIILLWLMSHDLLLNEDILRG